MNIEERAAQAAAWKATGQCNCAQAVLKAFEDRLPVDTDTLMKLGAGYAAGMGCMESTCGALIGAVMVAGIVTDGTVVSVAWTLPNSHLPLSRLYHAVM